MHSTPGKIAFNNTQYVYIRETNHAVVRHWAAKHKAQKTVEYVPQLGIISELHDAGWDSPQFINGSSPKYKETHMVWAALSSTPDAYHEATLIESLLSADSAQDYKRLRRTLSQAGYPDGVLDTVPMPK
jgi:hypothetical protein